MSISKEEEEEETNSPSSAPDWFWCASNPTKKRTRRKKEFDVVRRWWVRSSSSDAMKCGARARETAFNTVKFNFQKQEKNCAKQRLNLGFKKFTLNPKP